MSDNLSNAITDTIVKTKTTCGWLQNNGEPCPQLVIHPKKRCGRHKSHEDSNIDDFLICNRCGFVPKNDDGCCNKCVIKNFKNREKRKIIRDSLPKCQYIFKEKDKNDRKCELNCIENSIYCGNHAQIGVRVENFNNSPIEMHCINYVLRNCQNVPEKGRRTCEECLKKDRESEKNLRTKKYIIAQQHNETNNVKICIKCNRNVESNATKPNICLTCHNEIIKSEDMRNARCLEVIKHKYFKKDCIRRNKNIDIPKDIVQKMFKQPCAYCGKSVILNGIDRVDSSLSYTLENVVTCCKYCNIMKQSYTVENFLKIVRYILSTKKMIDETPNKDDIILFHVAKNPKYSYFCLDVNYKNKWNDITENEYHKIISKNCEYCEIERTNGACGIDRINSLFGYTIANSRPCCYTCNVIKNDLTEEELYFKLMAIYNYSILKKEPILSDKEKLLSLCERSSLIITEKFMYNHEFYLDKIISPAFTLDDVANIKIKLEFVENDELLTNIWNYYRRHYAYLSLKYNQNQFYITYKNIKILVKDETTDKYLGFVELTKMPYNIYINGKYDKIPYSMNVHTCVAFEPFKTKFNGKELIASIIGTKEVSNHYFQKYNEPLLLVTFTTLKNTNIYYDNLPSLKYDGIYMETKQKNITNESIMFCCKILGIEYFDDYTYDSKVSIICATFARFEISKESYFSQTSRGCYVMRLYDFTYDVIYNKVSINTIDTKQIIENIKSIDEISKLWIEQIQHKLKFL